MLPTSEQIRPAVLAQARKIDRTYHRSEMHRWMAEYFKLTSEETWRVRDNSPNITFTNMVDWAHNYLQERGHLLMLGGNSGRYQAMKEGATIATQSAQARPVKTIKPAMQHKSVKYANDLATQHSKWDTIFGKK